MATFRLSSPPLLPYPPFSQGICHETWPNFPLSFFPRQCFVALFMHNLALSCGGQLTPPLVHKPTNQSKERRQSTPPHPPSPPPSSRRGPAILAFSQPMPMPRCCFSLLPFIFLACLFLWLANFTITGPTLSPPPHLRCAVVGRHFVSMSRISKTDSCAARQRKRATPTNFLRNLWFLSLCHGPTPRAIILSAAIGPPTQSTERK